MTLSALKKDLRSEASLKRAKALKWFFKTGPGEYGEGDIFLGVKVGGSREVAKKYQNLLLNDVKKLLHSKIHEERTVALLILIHKFKAGNEREKKKIFDFYLKNTKYINNWDLVDVSAHRIVGEYLNGKPKKILFKLAKSKNLWERRIAIIATFHFIKYNQFSETLKISQMLLKNEHDLIHKAVGWALREVGKRDLKEEEKFLKKYYKKMPRTMLRYAIERFPEKRRKKYLKGKI